MRLKRKLAEDKTSAKKAKADVKAIEKQEEVIKETLKSKELPKTRGRQIDVNKDEKIVVPKKTDLKSKKTDNVKPKKIDDAKSKKKDEGTTKKVIDMKSEKTDDVDLPTKNDDKRKTLRKRPAKIADKEIKQPTKRGKKDDKQEDEKESAIETTEVEAKVPAPRVTRSAKTTETKKKDEGKAVKGLETKQTKKSKTTGDKKTEKQEIQKSTKKSPKKTKGKDINEASTQEGEQKVEEETAKKTSSRMCNTAKDKGNALRIVSWNIAGLKSWLKKQCLKDIMKGQLDILALQETKCGEVPKELASQLKDYNFHLNSSEKLGYSGVLLISKEKPLNVWTGPKKAQNEVLNEKGRFIISEFKNFYFINAYVPNSGRGLVNLTKRVSWNENFLNEIKELDAIKPVIIAGDMNVAHNEKDLANPKTNKNKTAGFTDEERRDFSRLLDSGFVDVFRELNPDKEGAYTFWSNMHNSRANNVGWRLDYFIVSRKLFEHVQQCEIHSEIMGSDHCPISLEIST